MRSAKAALSMASWPLIEKGVQLKGPAMWLYMYTHNHPLPPNTRHTACTLSGAVSGWRICGGPGSGSTAGICASGGGASAHPPAGQQHPASGNHG
eukprot:1158044-Pelagomonas_calceolata.AAC.7